MRDRTGKEIEQNGYVRISRAEPAKGTWRRHMNKVGEVISTAPWEDELQVKYPGTSAQYWFRRTEVLVIDRAEFTREALGPPYCNWCQEKRVPTRENKFCSTECYYASIGKVPR